MISSPVLPRCWVVTPLPLRSLTELMPASARTTIWIVLRIERRDVADIACSSGTAHCPRARRRSRSNCRSRHRPCLRRRRAHWRCRRPAAPAPTRPGTAFSHMSLSWPPSGIQTPPCGPVINLSSAACAVAVAKPATIIDASNRIFIGRSPWDTRRLAGRSCCLAQRLRGRVGRRQAGLRVGTNLTPPGAPIHKKNAAIHKFGFEPERLRLIGPHPTVQCTSVWSPFHQARPCPTSTTSTTSAWRSAILPTPFAASRRWAFSSRPTRRIRRPGSRAKPVQPQGSGNRCVMFASDYLEILASEDPARPRPASRIF